MGDKAIRIARVFGIDIKIHFTWPILFILVAFSFTAVVLPTLYPQFTTVWTSVIGLALTLLLFASVVLHELAHALYAKSQGIPVKRITLFVFGGAAEIEKEPKTPGQEFVMAAVGPLTSIAISVVFFFILTIGVLTDILALQAIGGILAVVNFLLAIFNLLPGFPLDGGRILRAAVWKMTNSLEKATKAAFISGKVFGLSLIIYGLMLLIVYGLAGGLWLGLIGFFIIHSAKVNFYQTMLNIKFQGTTVGEVMDEASFEEEHLVELRPSDPIQKAVEIMHNDKKSILYVGENKQPIGIITADMLQKLLRSKIFRSH